MSRLIKPQARTNAPLNDPRSTGAPAVRRPADIGAAKGTKRG